MKKFSDFVKEREGLAENKDAFSYDVKLQQFRNRFPDGDGEAVVQGAGYPSVRHFLHDPDEKKWSKLRIPGQKNYVR